MLYKQRYRFTTHIFTEHHIYLYLEYRNKALLKQWSIETIDYPKICIVNAQTPKYSNKRYQITKDTKKPEIIHTDTIYEFIITHIARTHTHVIHDSNVVLYKQKYIYNTYFYRTPHIFITSNIETRRY